MLDRKYFMHFMSSIATEYFSLDLKQFENSIPETHRSASTVRNRTSQ